ncbi:MAG: hypothetical protein KA393_00110 [Limnohabitans sp.]|nr:hypothetical protein [Limnohabitans sp.]
MPSAAGSSAPNASAGQAFQKTWAEMRQTGNTVQVENGDTLIGLVKAHYRQNGTAISENQAYTLAHQIAKQNQVANPDLIVTGQKIDFSSLNLPPLARASATGPLEISSSAAMQSLQGLKVSGVSATAAEMLAQRSLIAPTTASEPTALANSHINSQHPILDRTLARAVQKGFVPSEHVPEVRQKILTLAQRYNFAPDDFARLSLIESGGMNPQATNGSCHGIIQFCDGPNRGAAVVGMKNNPKAILGMGLLQQMDLVDKYFAQSGLNTKGPKVGLDDLYLTILTPAARRETRPDAPLPIAGPQAKILHVGGDTQGPITRNSILSGLHALTQTMLEPSTPKVAGNRWYSQVANSTATTLR